MSDETIEPVKATKRLVEQLDQDQVRLQPGLHLDGETQTLYLPDPGDDRSPPPGR